MAQDEATEVGEIPLITKAELKRALGSLKNRRARQNIGRALKVAVRVCPQLLLDMYNQCIGRIMQAVEDAAAAMLLGHSGEGA